MKTVVDRGSGPPVLLIPGIQGRWEWLLPAVRTLELRHRVLALSLGTLGPADPGFGTWIERLAGIARRSGNPLTVVGVSFGGLLALRLAAVAPDLVTNLVLVSTPAPRWELDPTSAGFARHPTVSLPLFALRGIGRLAPEIVSSQPDWNQRLGLALDHGLRVLRFPPSAHQMASWVRAWMATDFGQDCPRVRARVLLVTGEDHLDRVVPVRSTLEYLSLLPGATHVRIAHTGHIGMLSKPDVFADRLESFLRATRSDGVPERSPKRVRK